MGVTVHEDILVCINATWHNLLPAIFCLHVLTVVLWGLIGTSTLLRSLSLCLSHSSDDYSSVW